MARRFCSPSAMVPAPQSDTPVVWPNLASERFPR